MSGTAGLEIVGLWGAEVLTATLNGQVVFRGEAGAGHGPVPGRAVIVSGEIQGATATARVDGYSTDALNPGNFNGQLETTKR
jgi:hypothetical protein